MDTQNRFFFGIEVLDTLRYPWYEWELEQEQFQKRPNFNRRHVPLAINPDIMMILTADDKRMIFAPSLLMPRCVWSCVFQIFWLMSDSVARKGFVGGEKKRENIKCIGNLFEPIISVYIRRAELRRQVPGFMD